MQTSGDLDSEEIFSFLLLIHRKMSKPLEEHFKDKFTSLQFHALCALCTSGSMTMTELAHMMHTPKQQMTKIVDRLVEEGHIVRNTDTDDRRCIRISISENTAKYIAKRRKQFISAFKQELLDVDCEDYDKFFQAVRLINRILRRYPVYSSPSTINL